MTDATDPLDQIARIRRGLAAVETAAASPAFEHVQQLMQSIGRSIDDLEAMLTARTEWRTRSVEGIVFECRGENHARGMVGSTSPMLGTATGRVVERRVTTSHSTGWEEA